MDITNQSQIKDGKKTVKSNTLNVPYEKNCTVVKSTTFTGNATPGDTITWKTVITNPNSSITKTNILFSDTLDVNTTYVAGSFKVNGTAATPTAMSPAVTYTILTLAGGASVTIEFDVLVS